MCSLMRRCSHRPAVGAHEFDRPPGRRVTHRRRPSAEVEHHKRASPADAGTTGRRSRAMGFMDKVKGMLSGRSAQTDKGIEKGGDVLDDRTGGKYAGHVDKGQDAARDALRKMDEEGGAGRS